MKLYDQIVKLVKGFSDKLPKDSVTSVGVSGSLVTELTLMVSLLIVILLFRHLNILLSAILVLVIGVILVSSMPISLKFEKEQDDSLNNMLFYTIITLGILVTFIYWGGIFV